MLICFFPSSHFFFFFLVGLCVIRIPERSEMQLWVFLPRLLFLTAERRQFSTNNTEQ